MSRRATRVARVAVGLAVAVGISACGAGSDAPRRPTAVSNLADRGFLNQMIDHHEEVARVARIGAKRASHRELRAVAREVARLQEADVVDMRRLSKVVRRGLPLTIIGPSMNALSQEEFGELHTTRQFDRLFIDRLVPHLTSAVDTARLELEKGRNASTRAVARRIVATETPLARRMGRWREEWFGAPIPDEAFSPERGEEEEEEGG